MSLLIVVGAPLEALLWVIFMSVNAVVAGTSCCKRAGRRSQRGDPAS